MACMPKNRWSTTHQQELYKLGACESKTRHR
jgi:hypothetical protein